MVHRLIAMTFLGMPEDSKKTVNHKDLDKANNRPENLEWLTLKENIRHASKIIPRLRGAEIAWSNKLTQEQVLSIRARYVPHVMSLKMLAKEFSVSEQTVHAIIHRRKWKHL